MTVVNPKSISGINSITTGSGSDNLLTIHTSDASSTERVRINSSGDVIVGSGITVSPDGDIFATGVTTSTTFVGALTGNVTGNISGGTVAGSTGTFTGDVDIASSLVHTGDTDTKLTFTTDNISLVTGGTTRVNITSAGNLEMPNDNDYIKIGAGGDLSLVHNGSTSYVQNATGFLEFQSDGHRFSLQDGTEKARFDTDGRLLLGATSSGHSNRTLISSRDSGNYISIITDSSDACGITFGDSTSGTGNYETYMAHSNTNNDFTIYTAQGVKQFAFKSGGDLSISDGNLVVASGHGIDFSATGTTGSNTSNESELFSDYEQGSCTILIQDAAGSNISVTGGNHKYTLIGNRVFIEGQFTFAESGSKNGGTMSLYQLPFTPAQNNPTSGNFWYDATSDGGDVTGIIYPSTSAVCYLKQSTTIGQPSNQKYLTFNEIQANSSRQLFISFSYTI